MHATRVRRQVAHFSLFPADIATEVAPICFSTSLLLLLAGVSDIENTMRGAREQQSGPTCDEAGLSEFETPGAAMFLSRQFKKV